MSEEENILIEVGRSESSQDDPNRTELLWSKKQESILIQWREDMLQRSKYHDAKAARYKKLYNLFGLPSVIIPVALSALSNILKDYELVNSLLLLAAGVFAGVSTFLNLGKKAANHAEFENRYDQLARRIDKELAKPKKNRLACDVYFEKIELKFSSLNVRAPR